MDPARLFVASMLVSGFLGTALIGPAAAHKRSITQVYVNNDFDPILVGAWVEPECHPGTMKITLKKKNADGVWVNVITKKADC